MTIFDPAEGVPPNPAHDDIYLVEFPRSGITWLSFILGNIELRLAGAGEFVTYYNHHRHVVDVHQLRGGGRINRRLGRTFIKSHSTYNPDYYFVVYLVRNPIDVMVSYYNFMRREQDYRESFDHFVRHPLFGVGKWKEHVNSWLYVKDEPQRLHLLRYEDLVRDAQRVISGLYMNLGVALEEVLLRDALERSSLESMKQSEEHYRRSNPRVRAAYIGKERKIPRSDLLTDDVMAFIIGETVEELRAFYPDLLPG